jgi:D-beta-D-heptose 7-phosphate kinase/D-beta-D-heptose 1-phosphate adenosyltransferase
VKAIHSIPEKILTLEQLNTKVAQWKILGKTISFTNGCFDILHPGHIASLSEAAKLADKLVVGLNTDSSVKQLKGSNRPINNQDSRALVLASLAIVDAEPTPLELIKTVAPDFLVKGGDYKVHEIAGAKEVLEAGGQVIINPIIEGFSTTNLIEKLQLH